MLCYYSLFLFFFSSRRRHTRSLCDWSSDVCSSDLFQLAGHRPIVLMGGGTGLIGDPSGKKSERPLLSEEQIRENVRRQRDQLVRLFDFDAKETRALVMNNADWLVDQRLVAFLRDVGKHFSINVMMQKESVKARLDAGISYTEFSYMLLQAYDFLHLSRKEQCTIQVGGSDQWEIGRAHV